jgi:hypothetical protein
MTITYLFFILIIFRHDDTTDVRDHPIIEIYFKNSEITRIAQNKWAIGRFSFINYFDCCLRENFR